MYNRSNQIVLFLFLVAGVKMAEGFKEQDPTFATRAIHVGQEPELWESMAVVPPISLATTFKQDGPANFKVKAYFNSRIGTDMT